MIPLQRRPAPAPDPPGGWSGSRVVLHVDMDAFFAAVEVLDDPRLAGVALIVGGDGERGVVASCSYEARRYGVRSAMPSAVARRLCPTACFRPGRYDRYQEVSAALHEVLLGFTPLVEGIALDEAFLDVTGALRLFGAPEEVGHVVREAVGNATGLACSVGVASSKYLAKLASEAAKPVADVSGVRPGPGVVLVAPGTELEFLHPLPVEALWGVGPATARRLHDLGVLSVGQIAGTAPGVLERALGRAAGAHLRALAAARDPRPVQPQRPARSIGHEETFARDRWDRDGLQRELVRMSDSVAARLRSAGVSGRTVTVKVRFPDFVTVTRSVSRPAGTDDGPGIARAAAGLLDGVDLSAGVRLLGVSVTSLQPAGAAAEQLELDFGAGGHSGTRGRAAARAVDAVRGRFGAGAVGPATLVEGRRLRVGRGDNRWQPVDGKGPEACVAVPTPRREDSPASG